MATDVNEISTVSRALPVVTADGQPAKRRVDRYGGSVVGLSPRRQAADEGCYFVCTNPTPGTGIQFAAITESQSFAAATKAAMFIVQNNNKPGGKRIYLDRLKLMPTTAVPSTVTQLQLAFDLDSLARTTTPPTNITQITPVNVNGDDGTLSNATVWFPLTSSITTAVAASLSSRFLGRVQIPTGQGVLGDEYGVLFGDNPPGGNGGTTAVRATDPATRWAAGPPIIIAPQQVCVCRWCWVTQTVAASIFEFELSYFER